MDTCQLNHENRAVARITRPRRGPDAKGSITIREVAAKAGVSTATVSRALASPDQVSPEARARVTAAIKATGYTPSAVGRSLRARSTKIVLVVVPNIANPFFAEILRGIDDELAASGYGLIIGNLDNLVEREARYVDLVFGGQADGVLLFAGRIPAANGRRMNEAGVPMAAVCVKIPGLPYVMVNDGRASALIMRHLLGLGHRRFGYISGPQGNANEIGRRTAFRRALAAADLDPDEAAYWQGDFMLESGVRAAHQFLALNAVRRPTAVYSASDHMAIAFMKTIASAGIRIPEDVSIVGFDGIEFGAYVTPTLTTLPQPRHELGRTGARVLVEALRSGGTPESVELDASLLVRESTAPPPAKGTHGRRR
jgi:LacI family transcriptional regulator, repressor for deo operon, udp, cdd, tsx, nupC, and nupG